jgi:hypothetical protein
VLAPREGPFHYSPLKLAEYLASGLAVVAPAIGQLSERLTDGVDAVVVPPHDPLALGAALRRLRDDPEERARLGKGARAAAEAEWSWDHQIGRVVDALAYPPVPLGMSGRRHAPDARNADHGAPPATPATIRFSLEELGTRGESDDE